MQITGFNKTGTKQKQNGTGIIVETIQKSKTIDRVIIIIITNLINDYERGKISELIL